MANIGDKIKILYMEGEPSYTNKEGVIKSIDDLGMLHGTWGGVAVIPEKDTFEVIDDDLDEEFEIVKGQYRKCEKPTMECAEELDQLSEANDTAFVSRQGPTRNEFTGEKNRLMGVG